MAKDRKKVISRKKKKQLDKFLHQELKLRQKLQLATLLDIINNPTFAKLKTLNKIRNDCVHNWILNTKVWKVKKKKRKKRPFVEYKNKNLFNQNVFLKEFLPEYNKLYLKLFEKTF